jgi:hypothetical protein
VVEPAHVGRAPLVALGVDALLVLGRTGGEHAALAGGQLLVRVEAERGGMAAAADRDPVGVDGAERLARVLDDRQPVPLERGYVRRIAEDVHRQQGFRAGGDGGGGGLRIEIESARVDVDEHRPRPLVEDRVRGRDERKRRRDHLIAVGDADGTQREVQRRGAGGDRGGVTCADALGECLLERRDARAEGEMPRAEHLDDGGLLLRTEDRSRERDHARRDAVAAGRLSGLTTRTGPRPGCAACRPPASPRARPTRPR